MSDITQISLNGSVYNLRDKKWLDSITNCITEIPQDINLELNAGTLTLKAGSKVYKPNGVGVFNDYTTTQNYSITQTNNGTYLVFFGGSSLFTRDVNKCFSGTEPSPIQTYSAWYDTANNLIKYSTNTTTWQTGELYLPIAQVTVSGGAISSIDQVFNGFGYIGSSAFVLPGVKALASNGINPDGSYKNVVLNFTTVKVRTLNYANEASILCFLGSNGIAGYGVPAYFEQAEEPTSFGTYARWLNTDRNIMYYTSDSGSTWSATTDVFLGKMEKSNNANITSLSPRKTLGAVDCNNTSFISNQAMPSNKYIVLPTNISTSDSFTAPADGYFCVVKRSAAANEYINLVNNSNSLSTGVFPTTGSIARVFLPVSKGQTVTVNFSLTGSTDMVRFIYANGAK